MDYGTWSQEEAVKMSAEKEHRTKRLHLDRKRESKTEKRFNYVLVLTAKIIALVLAVLAGGGFAINAISVESMSGLLVVSLVILTLASIQDSMAIHHYCRELDELEYSQDHAHDTSHNKPVR